MKIILLCLLLVLVVRSTSIDTINVLLIGRANSGKSTLINQICQKEIVNKSTKSQEIHKYDFNPALDYEINYSIKFHDTPGLYSSEMETYDVLNKIGQITEIDVIVICIDLSEKLYDDNDMFKLLKTTFGAYVIKNTIIVFTKGDIVSTNTAIAKKRYNAINSKKIPYLVADNTKLANYKILHAITETGRYVWQNKMPVSYDLNACYKGSCVMPKIILYDYDEYLKPNTSYKPLTSAEKKEWLKIKNYIRYNIPYISVDIFKCSMVYYADRVYCNKEKPIISVQSQNAQDHVIISKIKFEDVIKVIYENI